jgi:hypothetical protein
MAASYAQTPYFTQTNSFVLGGETCKRTTCQATGAEWQKGAVECGLRSTCVGGIICKGGGGGVGDGGGGGGGVGKVEVEVDVEVEVKGEVEVELEVELEITQRQPNVFQGKKTINIMI